MTPEIRAAWNVWNVHPQSTEAIGRLQRLGTGNDTYQALQEEARAQAGGISYGLPALPETAGSPIADARPAFPARAITEEFH